MPGRPLKSVTRLRVHQYHFPKIVFTGMFSCNGEVQGSRCRFLPHIPWMPRLSASDWPHLPFPPCMHDGVDDTDNHRDDEGDIDGVGDDTLDSCKVFDIDRDLHRVRDVSIVECII